MTAIWTTRMVYTLLMKAFRHCLSSCATGPFSIPGGTGGSASISTNSTYCVWYRGRAKHTNIMSTAMKQYDAITTASMIHIVDSPAPVAA